jgi:uncharacterized protein YigE (DUF2233 family)
MNGLSFERVVRRCPHESGVQTLPDLSRRSRRQEERYSHKIIITASVAIISPADYLCYINYPIHCMIKSIRFLLASPAILLIVFISSCVQKEKGQEQEFIFYQVDPKRQDLRLYWKDDDGKTFRSIHNLKSWLNIHHQQLVFAMNGGMYKTDHSPVGLFIEDKKIIKAVDTLEGAGNFYLKPNGVFYVTSDNIAGISASEEFKNNGRIKYATQSGPMLVINGHTHPGLEKGSSSLNIRNGVGILPNNNILFAMSKNKISLYDFAEYFKFRGCNQALYFDGQVSRMYLPEKEWEQTDGDFGVIVGVTKPSI